MKCILINSFQENTVIFCVKKFKWEQQLHDLMLKQSTLNWLMLLVDMSITKTSANIFTCKTKVSNFMRWKNQILATKKNAAINHHYISLYNKATKYETASGVSVPESVIDHACISFLLSTISEFHFHYTTEKPSLQSQCNSSL